MSDQHAGKEAALPWLDQVDPQRLELVSGPWPDGHRRLGIYREGDLISWRNAQKLNRAWGVGFEEPTERRSGAQQWWMQPQRENYVLRWGPATRETLEGMTHQQARHAAAIHRAEIRARGRADRKAARCAGRASTPRNTTSTRPDQGTHGRLSDELARQIERLRLQPGEPEDQWG